MIVFVWTEIKICIYYRLRLQSSSCGRSLNVPVISKTTHPPPAQTPGHLTFVKHFGQIPRYVASLDGQMPHPSELQRGSKRLFKCTYSVINNWLLFGLTIGMSLLPRVIGSCNRPEQKSRGCFTANIYSSNE